MRRAPAASSEGFASQPTESVCHESSPAASSGDSIDRSLRAENDAIDIEELTVDIALIENAETDLQREIEAGSRDSEEPDRKRRKLSDPSQERSCLCTSDVTESWKKSIMQKRALGLAKDMSLLSRMLKFDKVCYPHAKAMGGHLGLMVKRLSYPQLLARMRDIFDRRQELGKLKTDQQTYSWFRVANRPPRPSDMLGPYKFTHDSHSDFEYDQDMLLGRLGVDVEAWHKDGSVNVALFQW